MSLKRQQKKRSFFGKEWLMVRTQRSAPNDFKNRTLLNRGYALSAIGQQISSKLQLLYTEIVVWQINYDKMKYVYERNSTLNLKHIFVNVVVVTVLCILKLYSFPIIL